MLRGRDVVRFARGDRRAIEQVSGSLWSLPVGALFIAVAVIARNYDQASLRHSPERILGPFAFSLMSSALVFGVLYRSLGVKLWKSGAPFRWQYLGFLGAFWMTAPMAWLYALPVERWTDPVTAAWANVGLLGVVSVWRVALISRVASVLTGVSGMACLVTVLAVASFEFMVVGIVGVVFGSDFGRNLASSMAGIRLEASPAEQVAASLRGRLMVTLPWVFVLATIVNLAWTRVARRPFPQPQGSPPPWGLLLGGVGLLVAAVILALPFQRSEGHWHVLEEKILSKQYGAGLDYLEAAGPDAFPPGKALPLDAHDFWAVYHLPELLKRLDGTRPEWMRAHYFGEALRLIERIEGYRAKEEVTKLTQALAQTPRGRDFIETNQGVWERKGYGEDVAGWLQGETDEDDGF